MARMGAEAQARHDEPRGVMSAGGSALMSNASLGFVAEAATEGQSALFRSVVDREFGLRRASRVARLEREADLPFQKGFDGFEWDGIGFPGGFPRGDVLALSFVGRHEGLVLFGGSGNGRSHTAVALGTLACGMGMRVRLFTTSALANELDEANSEGRATEGPKTLAKGGMTMLDEWGCLPTDPDGARLLSRVVSMCYERISLVLTTDIELSRRGEILDDGDMAKAMMDRMVHHGRPVTYEREGYRMKHALVRDDL
ncbi:ATP-binding protein [Olsenella sp. Marseille-P4559]|uniref:ATP-binding protein n=1 Tax=Olsenella sp. Marseille-P4559 TaxID=2364795 RepID=UPI0010314992|nr:ATP-binding protein [Olsenella sp. Marseille-P4559]